jgi:hypothetical protein
MYKLKPDFSLPFRSNIILIDRVNGEHPDHMSGSHKICSIFLMMNNRGASGHSASINYFTLIFGALKKCCFLFHKHKRLSWKYFFDINDAVARRNTSAAGCQNKTKRQKE